MAEKMDGKTMNITQENIAKMQELFPEVFTEGKIDFDKLQVVLGENIDKSNERYEFSWNGKFEAMKLAQLQSTGTLIPCKEKSKDWDKTQNLYIEGDNLEVLKLLQKSYVNQIKMIYIDPPYNTGNDFVYKDNFADNIANYKEVTGQATKSNAETAGRYHTNWLNMMYPRLKLARNLLKDDGVIFISIDDNEQANLKRMCDEIFGENNYIDTLKWKRKKQPSFLATHTAKVMEYILIYARKKEKLEKLSIEGTSDSTKKVINISNKEVKRNFKCGVEVKIDGCGIIPAGRYKIKTMEVEYLNDVSFENGKTTNSVDVISRFTDSQENIDKFIDNNLLFISKQYGLRRYVSEDEKGKRKSITDLLLEWGDNQDSDKEFIDLFGEKYFEYVKPIKLISNLIKCNFTENEIILDFFSGSATTANAILELNKEDDGNRKFICVQLPENLDRSFEQSQGEEKKNIEKVIRFLDEINKPHYITEIGEERIRRAGQKIVDEHPELAQSLDVGFKVFKLESSNLVKWDNTPTENIEELEQRLQQSLFYIVDGRTNEDLVYEIMLKYGLPLTLPIHEKQFGENKAYIVESDTYKVMICLDRNLSIDTIEQMTDEPIGTYVFADHCFADANALINTEEILKKKSKNLRIF